MNGVIISGCVPARGGPVGGTEAASSARYLRTVRQSQPHSRPISTNVAPAACRARKRRMFIQDSVSRIMREVTFGSSAWRWTNRRVTQLKTSRDSTRRATRQVVRRTTYEVVRGQVLPTAGAARDGEGWVSRKVGPNGVVCVGWQQVSVGKHRAGARCDVLVSDQLLQFWIGEELMKTVTRTSSGEVRKKHAQGSRAQV